MLLSWMNKRKQTRPRPSLRARSKSNALLPPSVTLGAEVLEDRVLPAFVFSSPTAYLFGGGSGSYDRQVIVKDFNGDGKLDVAEDSGFYQYSSPNYNYVGVFTGTGTGTFGTAANYGSTLSQPGYYSLGMAAGDLNGDGKPEIVTQGNYYNYFNVFANSAGVFSSAQTQSATTDTTYDYGYYPSRDNSVQLGDFNHDGKLDLIVGSFAYYDASVGNYVYNGYITIFNGNGGGTFSATPSTTIALPGSGGCCSAVPSAIAVGDFNGDGYTDFAVGMPNTNQVLVYLNNAGVFSSSPSQTLSSGSSPNSIAVADLNADGKMDLVVANKGSNTINIYLGGAGGTFSTGTSITANLSSPYGVAVGDLNGDGKLDVVAANQGNSTLTVYQGNGNGTFSSSPSIISVGSNPSSVAIGDFNGDGAPDLAVGYYSAPVLGILLNASITTTSLTSSVNPSSLGQPVTFTATVTPTITPGSPISPTGTVNFYDGATLLGSGTLNASGVATFTTSSLIGGSHSITAVYVGDGTFKTSTSPVLTQVVNLATTTTSLTSSLNPAAIGQNVTFTATVTPGGPGTPTGTVSFFDNGTLLGSATLNGAGQAIFSTSFSTVGNHTILAVYNGNASFQGSQASLIEVINFGVANALYAAGADAGGSPQVNVYDAATGQLKFGILAYAAGFRGGVRVAVGDVNGDGVDDIITAAGPGGGPQVNVYDGRTGQLISAFYAINGPSPFGTNQTGTASVGNTGSVGMFTGGLFVAAGDVNGDGAADIIVGADAGGGPQVQVFDGRTLKLIASFYAFSPGFTGGVRVAAADVDGDKKADIIVGAGKGGGPQVTVFSGATFQPIASFFAFAPNFTGGVYVAGGDTNGDRRAEVIVGAGPGGGPQVSIFDAVSHRMLNTFFATDPHFKGGVRVGTTDINNDGLVEITTSLGPQSVPNLQVFDSTTLALLQSFIAYPPGFLGGFYVG